MSGDPRPLVAAPAPLRRGLHLLHALATLVLLATGFLIEFPDLRARVVGGYGRELARWHLWLGWAFLLAPALALALATRPLLLDLRLRLGPAAPLSWRKAHLLLTLATGLLLGLTGVLLWIGYDVLPRSLLDVALEVHIAATWVLAAALPVHLAAAWRELGARARDPGTRDAEARRGR